MMIKRGWKKPVIILDLYFFMSETPFERRPPLMFTERMKKTVTDTEIRKRKSINTIQHHAFTSTTITTTRDHQKTHKPTHARERHSGQASERKKKGSKEKKIYNKRGKKGGKGKKRKKEGEKTN